MNTNIQRTLNMHAHTLPRVLTDKQNLSFFRRTPEKTSMRVSVCCGWTYSFFLNIFTLIIKKITKKTFNSIYIHQNESKTLCWYYINI